MHLKLLKLYHFQGMRRSQVKEDLQDLSLNSITETKNNGGNSGLRYSRFSFIHVEFKISD